MWKLLIFVLSFFLNLAHFFNFPQPNLFISKPSYKTLKHRQEKRLVFAVRSQNLVPVWFGDVATRCSQLVANIIWNRKERWWSFLSINCRKVMQENTPVIRAIRRPLLSSLWRVGCLYWAFFWPITLCWSLFLTKQHLSIFIKVWYTNMLVSLKLHFND